MKKAKSKGVFFLVFSLMVVLLIGCHKNQKKPNIVFILSDDHGAQAVSCYDSTLIQTPNIDRIASGGAIFNNCFVTNSICAPSRAAILTGKYGHKNGVTGNDNTFDNTQITFPKLLNNAGYQTALVGKWHLKSTPTGFDYWNILPGQGDYIDPVFIERGDTVSYKGYVTDIITDLSLEWLKQRDKSKPFCLLTHHKAVHTPNIPPEKYEGLFEVKYIPLPETFYDDYSNRSKAASLQRIEFTKERPDFPKHYRNVPDTISEELYPEAKYQLVMKDYLACVKSMDDNIGRIISWLKENNLAENTILIYASDQGFFLGEHRWFNKRFMYEESIKMPLVVQYPARVKPGTVVNEMIMNIDFAPTILDFAGSNVPEKMQGRSFRNILTGNKLTEPWRDVVYYHYYERGFGMQKHYGIRTQRYKLIHFYEPIDEWEMFDLTQDPHEMNNIYNNPDYSESRKDLKQQLLEQIKKCEDTTVPTRLLSK